MTLSNYTNEQLRTELKKREKNVATKPVLLASPDLSALQALCQEQIDCLSSGKGCNEDLDMYIYEAAMEALYGDGVFNWINACL